MWVLTLGAAVAAEPLGGALPAHPLGGALPAHPLGDAAATPIVIGHRGAPAVVPDHTLAGYRAAIAMGADYIEPDLVSTRDGHIICRHENELGHTTDVASKFADRETRKTIDGKTVEGWFAEDFTLAEIRTLRAVQPLAFRPHDQDGEHLIPTFVEVLELVVAEQERVGRPIGVYPETKHPTYHDAIGLALEEPLLNALKEAGLDGREHPVFIQSFEPANLRKLRGLTTVRLVQLVGEPGGQLTPDGFKWISAYADGIGVHKSHLISEADGTANDVVEKAHAAGLVVHVYTFRPEERYLPVWSKGDALVELRRFYDLGVDGVFADLPAQAREALGAR